MTTRKMAGRTFQPETIHVAPTEIVTGPVTEAQGRGLEHQHIFFLACVEPSVMAVTSEPYILFCSVENRVTCVLITFTQTLSE